MKKIIILFVAILFSIQLKSQGKDFFIKPNKDTVFIELKMIDEYDANWIKAKINGKTKTIGADSIFQMSYYGNKYQSIKVGKSWRLMLIAEVGELSAYYVTGQGGVYVKPEKHDFEHVPKCTAKDLKSLPFVKCKNVLDSLVNAGHSESSVIDLVKDYNRICAERSK